MTEREKLIGILATATTEGLSRKSRVETEKLADYLVSEGVKVRDIAEWETERDLVRCSICHLEAPVYTVRQAFGTTIMRRRRTSFCPNCGAKMIGG